MPCRIQSVFTARFARIIGADRDQHTVRIQKPIYEVSRLGRNDFAVVVRKTLFISFDALFRVGQRGVFFTALQHDPAVRCVQFEREFSFLRLADDPFTVAEADFFFFLFLLFFDFGFLLDNGFLGRGLLFRRFLCRCFLFGGSFFFRGLFRSGDFLFFRRFLCGGLFFLRRLFRGRFLCLFYGSRLLCDGVG